MFCDKCEEIVNLDILLTTLVKRPEREPETPKQPRPHQENFAALVTSADAGCVICSLVRGQVLPKDRPVYNAIAVPTGQITFSLHHRSDVVIFDTDDHNKSSGDWGMGFCNIRLRSIEGDPITNLMPGLFTSRPVADDSGSEACFKMAKFWLKTCLETHDDLCQVKRSLPLPTRVLDVGIPESPSATLHISNGEYGEWVTLSHCWGKFHPATTTAENLSSQCNGILVSTLPKTFQDTITITRKLGYRYLWIDSLCIIQDSILDWERESVKMNTVYANAVLNISADAAADSSEGIFESSNRKIDGKAPFFTPPRQDYTRIPVHSPKSGLKSTLYASLWHGNEFADNDHIGGRGWVLQEAVLSHRRLRYTSSGIAWSCARVPSFCDETRPHEIHDLTEQDSYITSVYQIPRQPLPPRYIYEPKDAGRRYQVIQWWYRRINDYVNRQLTFSLDKFPAFSGIAEAYCDRTQYHYKAGIMIEDFRRGLLWQPCGRPIDLEVGPSWSWAIVGYSRKKAYETDGEVYDCTYAHFTYVDDADEVELVDISVENLGDNPFGQVVSGGRLILRGLCHELKEILQTMDFYYLSGWHRYGRFWDQNYQKVWWEQTFLPPKALRLQLDLIHASNSRIPQREDIHLLRIGMFSSDPILDPETSPCVCGESTSYLIIQEIPGLEASYRRIGIASIVGDGVKSQDWKMKTVTIL